MKPNRQTCFYTWRANYGTDHPSIFLIKYGRMQFIENWKKWIDGFGYGFCLKDKKISNFKNKPNQIFYYDLLGQSFPTAWIEKSSKFVVMEREEETIVWFWEKDWRLKGDQFLRCAKKEGEEWNICSPLVAGWEVGGEIIRFGLKGGKLNLGKSSKRSISIPDHNEVMKLFV